MNLFDDLPEPSTTSNSNNNANVDATSDPHELGTIPTAPELQPAILRVISSVAARKGERPEMQDAHVCMDDFSPHLRTPSESRRLSYFAVFDGHGGCRASAYAAKRLHLYLASRLPKGSTQLDKDIKRILYDVFKKTDEDFLRDACQQRPHWRDGSTASVVLLVDNTLYVANIGDSKVVVARNVNVAPMTDFSEQNGKPRGDNAVRLAPVCLTRDHNPMDYAERQRIQATGATVQNGRINSILEVSRSFGDYQFKKQGVTCIPDIRKYQLTEQDRFLLIACDGLWKSFPPEEAITLTDRLLTKEFSTIDSVDRKPDMNRLQRCVESVCTHLVNEAVLRMSGDNVTCILVVALEAFVPIPESSSNNSEDVVPPVASSTAEPPVKVAKLS